MYSINILESDQLHLVKLTHWIEWHLCSMYLWLVSHFHPGPFSTGELYLSSILVPYHPIHVSRCASHLNPGPISTPSRSRDLCLLSTQAPRFVFLLCLCWISPQSRSWYLHLAYIQETSHLHPGPPSCVLVPSKHHLTPIYVSRCVSHLHPGPFSTGELYLSSTLVRCISLSPSKDVHLNSIQVPSQPHPGLEICVSSPPRLPYLRFFFVSVESYFNLVPDIYISPTSR